MRSIVPILLLLIALCGAVLPLGGCLDIVKGVQDFSQGVSEVTKALEQSMGAVRALVARLRDGALTLQELRREFDAILDDLRSIEDLTAEDRVKFRADVERLLTEDEMQLFSDELKTFAPDAPGEAPEPAPAVIEPDGGGSLQGTLSPEQAPAPAPGAAAGRARPSRSKPTPPTTARAMTTAARRRRRGRRRKK